MIKGIHQSARNMEAKMKNLEIIANNLANVNTTGYKREIAFSEVMNRFRDQRYKQITDFTEGAMEKTGNQFDLALSGSGFFVVETERGMELTRHGSFTIDEEGYLMTKDGKKVMGESGVIHLENIKLDQTSEVTIKTNGEIFIGDEYRGRLMIRDIPDQRLLYRADNQRFFMDDREYLVKDESEFVIHQGFLEDSNVNPIMEMQEMIKLNRDYEASQKLIGHIDTAYGKVNQIGNV